MKASRKPTEIRNAEAYLARDNTLKILPFPEFQRRFEVKQRLGAGIFTDVFSAHDRDTDRDCAVKSIKKSALAPTKHVWGELSVVYSLESPSILRLVAAYASDTDLWLVIEHSTGDLRDAIAQKSSYSERYVASIIKSLISALAEIHKRGIAHGDFKPENILFVGEDPRLADTGAAQLLTPEAFTRTCAGSPDFVAPEVIAGGKPGKEADIWGVGVLTYLLLSGQVPFASGDLFGVYRKIVKAELEFGEEMSESAKEFIRACLVADPAQRITAEAAESHAWLSEEEDRELGCKDQVLAVLDARRDARVNRGASFVAKMKAKKAAAKTDEVKSEEV